jgi:hypothetical protein
MHLAGFIVALSALVAADAAEKGEGDERGRRRRALQGFSMSMSAPLFSVEGIEVPAFVLGKEEDITVSTLAIGSTVSKGAEEKPEEDIGAAAEKSKEVKAEKTEKAPKAEKNKGSKGRKLASDKVERQGAVQQADIPMAMSAPMSMSTESIEVPTFEVPTFGIAENDKALNDMGSKGRKLARDFQHR